MSELKNVIIVEDDPIAALLIKKVLEKDGAFGAYQHYPNGKAALDGVSKFLAVTGEIPDLILLDLNMPVMNGWQFLDTIGQDAALSQIPVVILTSSIDPRDISRSQKYSSVLGYLSKPINTKEVRRLLG